MARRNKESTLEALFAMPWWVSALLAGAAFLSPNILKLIFPASQSQMGVSIQQAFVTTAESFSPYLTAGLLIIAVIVFAKDTITNRKKSPAKTGHNRRSSNSSMVNKQKQSQVNSRVSDILADRVWEENQTVQSPKVIAVPACWSLDVLQSLEWKRFEELCEALFKVTGLNAKSTVFGADGGIDIEILSKQPPHDVAAIAQCKAWSNPVGVKEVRSFYGVMAAGNLRKGYFITTSSFTKDATAYAEHVGMDLIDAEKILMLLTALPEEKSKALLKLATAGDFTIPTCPKCGLKLVERKASSSSIPFWGCTKYPRCRGKLKMRKQNS